MSKMTNTDSFMFTNYYCKRFTIAAPRHLRPFTENTTLKDMTERKTRFTAMDKQVTKL